MNINDLYNAFGAKNATEFYAALAALASEAGGGVESVNGQTGVVVLDASDIGALPDSYTPDLTGQPASNISSGTFPDARIGTGITGSKINIAAGTDGLAAGDLQATIQALATRIQALEDAAV